MKRVLVLQGPNLDWLGTREVEVYGTDTLVSLTVRLDAFAATIGVTLEHFQSNVEGELVERVHAAARSGCSGAVVNAAGYTHTSVALRDAFLATSLPFVEVHLSNVARREPFRQTSLLADLAVIVGIEERLDVELIDDRVLVPERVLGNGQLGGGQGCIHGRPPVGATRQMANGSSAGSRRTRCALPCQAKRLPRMRSSTSTDPLSGSFHSHKGTSNDASCG